MEKLVTPGAWTRRRVFLTGHTGFMGGWLALWLKEMGAEVHGYALAPSTEPNLFTLAKVSSATASDMRGDVRDLVSVQKAMHAAAAEIVFHLAAQPLVLDSYATPVDTLATNIMGTAHVLEAARQESSVRAVIVVTSDKCYANDDLGRAFAETDPLGGHDPYSASKAGAEIVTAAYRDSFFAKGAGVSTVRAGNIIGGGDWAANRLIPDCVRAACIGAPVVLRHPQATRPWQHVLEALSGYLILAQQMIAGGHAFAGGWNFGPNAGRTATAERVATTMMARLGGSVRSENTPAGPREAALLALDSTKAAKALGWQPRWSLDRALQETADWYGAWRDGRDMNALTRDQIARYGQ